MGILMKEIVRIPLTPDYNNKITRCKPIKRLSFGKRKIILSDDEYEQLESLYRQYVDIYGVELGFIHYLVGNLSEIE